MSSPKLSPSSPLTRGAVELKFSSHPERVGFAQILLDLTASFALLNRLIKHYQHLLETQDVTTTRDSFGYSSKVMLMVPTGWQVVALLDDLLASAKRNERGKRLQFHGAGHPVPWR